MGFLKSISSKAWTAMRDQWLREYRKSPGLTYFWLIGFPVLVFIYTLLKACSTPATHN
jgi:hypothetical protein